jgi:zinc transport system ATP-binding protein
MTREADAAVIRLENVTFAYNGAPVIESADLTVRAGEFVSVVGPNGGGKTTLLRLVLGQVAPDAGRVRVFGRAPRAARRRIGYVPQHARFDPVFPATVLDVVLMGRVERFRPWPFDRAERAVALEALERVEMAELARRTLSELSGGQRQRVLIARALASGPELLLLDEPDAGVDYLQEDRLYRMLEDLAGELTVVLVTHDLAVVSNDLYGEDVSLIRHDYRCAEGHACTPS